MGKSSRGKRQKELQAKSTLKDKPLKIEGISSKWSLFHKLPLHFLLIAIVGFLAYSNTFNVPFHFDDTNNIVENYKLRDLSNFWPPSGSRWVGFLTFALNYKLGGLDTTGYHAVNLAIHIFNAILVYLFVILTFKTPYFMVRQAHHDATVTLSHKPVEWSKGFTYLPLFIALLFVSHPIQTQAVTYIVQRFTSLATMFYLLSLVMYIKFRSQQSAISGQQKLHATRYTLYAVSLISAILAMKTKEISFTLPVIIVLFEFMFFEGNIKKRMMYLIPMLLTMLIIPLSMIGIDKPVGDAIGELGKAAQETDKISRWSYLFTQFRVIVTYIRLLFSPINQDLDYDYPLYHSFFNPEVFLSFLFLLLIFSFGIYLFYSKRYKLSATRLTAFGIFWFFITLSVESSIIPIRDVIFEHRVYMPSVGIFIAAVASVFVFADSFKHKWPQAGKAIISVFVFIVIILSGVTCARNIIWQDEVSLWEDTVKKNPYKARGHDILGTAYYSKGLTDMAIEEYQIALSLKPDYAEAHSNLGNAYNNKGLTDMAIEHYQIALRLKPDYAEAHYNLGVAYYSKGLTDMAIEHYQIALSLKPDYAEAHSNLGNAYNFKGLTDMAIEHYQIALRLKPDYAEAHNNLGVAYYNKGLTDMAIEHYQIALRLKPDNVDVHINMANAYDDKGMTDKAIEHYQIALKLNPDHAEAHYNLGVTYERKGLLDEAIKQYQAALRLNPEFKAARNNLNRILQIKR